MNKGLLTNNAEVMEDVIHDQIKMVGIAAWNNAPEPSESMVSEIANHWKISEIEAYGKALQLQQIGARCNAISKLAEKLIHPIEEQLVNQFRDDTRPINRLNEDGQFYIMVQKIATSCITGNNHLDSLFDRMTIKDLLMDTDTSVSICKGLIRALLPKWFSAEDKEKAFAEGMRDCIAKLHECQAQYA